jgi:hypothetical protein
MPTDPTVDERVDSFSSSRCRRLLISDSRIMALSHPISHGAKARRVIASAALLFALLQAMLALAIEAWLPKLRDPLYGQKLDQLRELVGREYGKRIVLMLGSSRTVHGFDAAAFEVSSRRRGHLAAVYNFGIPGGGPLTELLNLKRLLSAGIHPDALLIEVLPALLVDESMKHEVSQYPAARLWYGELATLRPYLDKVDASRIYREWFASWCCPAYTHRLPIKRFCFPSLLPREGHEHLFAPFDQHGWAGIPDAVRTPECFQRGVAVAAQSYSEVLRDFHLSGQARRALNTLLSICQDNQIAATLIIMPEGPTFRSWYSSDSERKVTGYLSELARRYHVALVDARSWCDEPSFVDSHHLLNSGATAFSHKLADSAWSSGDQRMARLPATGSH